MHVPILEKIHRKSIFSQVWGYKSYGSPLTPSPTLSLYFGLQASLLTSELTLSPTWGGGGALEPNLLNGVARLSPKVALEEWLVKHRQNISPESVTVVQARLDNWDTAPGPAPRVPSLQPSGKGKGNPGLREVLTQRGPPSPPATAAARGGCNTFCVPTK